MQEVSKKVLVIGGASGIGEAVTERIERNTGLEVYVPAVTSKTMYGREVVHFEMDVTDKDSVVEYLGVHGPFGYIVYTAGVNNIAYIEDTRLYDFQRDFAVNAFGFATVLAEHSKMFGKETLLSAVAITSDAARNAMRGSAVYCSSKAALEQIIRVVSREWAPHTRVNGVAPAVVEDTPMSAKVDEKVLAVRGWSEEQAKNYELGSLPMQRRVFKEEVAEVVDAVLFGPAYQTGSIVHVSGGK